MKFPVIGSLVYWLFGYAWAWGDGNAFIGFTNFAFAYLDPEKVPSALFHVVSSLNCWLLILLLILIKIYRCMPIWRVW